MRCDGDQEICLQICRSYGNFLCWHRQAPAVVQFECGILREALFEPTKLFMPEAPACCATSRFLTTISIVRHYHLCIDILTPEIELIICSGIVSSCLSLQDLDNSI